jgi:leucyl aminopeptidase
MKNQFHYLSKFKKKSIDLYIFVICNDFKKNIEYISSLLDIKNIPKKLFDDTSNQRRLLFDDFEILFVGIGKEHKCDNHYLYQTVGKLGKEMNVEHNKNILLHLVSLDENSIKNQVVSYILGFYNFTYFKSDKSVNKTTTSFYHPKKKFKKSIESAIYEAETQNELRSLINTPANILNSSEYVKYIKNNIDNPIKIKILNENQLKKLGCNLILGVNQGSKNKPYMVIFEYNNQKSKEKPIVLIGKGVMFDSGGYHLKSGDFSDMKNDMTGSAIIYGIFKLLKKFNITGYFVGLLPIVENMIDANAVRPGDILISHNGKSVEITDTDAEGRLIMADALAYAEKYKPKLCIDVSTLTGQAAAIFDSKSSVIMGNNNHYIQKMIHAGMQNNEKIWELPMWKEYVDLTKSNIADFKNYTFESKAGTIMAGAFLSNFIPKDSSWIHLDIAGIDNLKNPTNMRNYGATGEILRSLFYFLSNK